MRISYLRCCIAVGKNAPLAGSTKLQLLPQSSNCRPHLFASEKSLHRLLVNPKSVLANFDALCHIFGWNYNNTIGFDGRKGLAYFHGVIKHPSLTICNNQIAGVNGDRSRLLRRAEMYWHVECRTSCKGVGSETRHSSCEQLRRGK